MVLNTRTRKIAVGGLMIALALLLPQVIHLIGGSDLGKYLLPMHIPVLLGGMLLGPVYGLVIGLISPLLSSFLTQMPPVLILPFMVIELAAYGFIGGLLYKTFNLRKRKAGAVISLVLSMLFGRLSNMLALFIATDFLKISKLGTVYAVNATVSGVVGILIQLLLIPALLYVLEKTGKREI